MTRIAAFAFVCLLTFGSASADDEALHTQTATIEPSVEQGSTPEQQAQQLAERKISEEEFHAGPAPKWVWGNDFDQSYWVRKSFELSDVKSALLKASSDNSGRIAVNGHEVATSDVWQDPMVVDVTKHLVAGKNLLEANIANDKGSTAGFILKLTIRHNDNSVSHIATDGSWNVDRKRDGDFQDTVTEYATLGDGPWGNVLSKEPQSGRVPRNVFELLPGFQVEKLFTVPKDELGSWVSITFDDKGRLLASDQGDLGICRITLPPPGVKGGETKVEHLDFSACDIQPTAAQGMLYAFDSLYLSINGGPGSGLYRARDTDGDDQFDECVLLKKLNGGGEHGPHALRLSPDGERIFLIAGNHTDPPFKAGEDLENEDYTSRIPTNWGEDLLLPRMWDANGHARGRMAPGGWIASTDPDGKTWDIWSIGYRNPYDMAFNADGELFAYDADREWDYGAPWYRPTRVVHATSGSEFGWRSGTGKWPEYYHDSLPPLVNIGPGSPVGVEFGYGLKFPAKYQKALYICDWTFGTMYAIHITPSGSSYLAEKNEFVSRTPLPLTDVAAGPDGALYFTIGGRGTQSELYRVTYFGDESTETAVLQNNEFAPERELRQIVESFHGRDYTVEEFAETLSAASANGLPRKSLKANYGDRTMLAALRRTTQNTVVASHVLKVWQSGNNSPNEHFESITALTRGIGRNGLNTSALRSASIDVLSKIGYGQLNATEQLKYLRTLALVWIRLGEPTDADRLQLIDILDDHFPAEDARLNRELCQMLVYLKSPTVVDKTIKLLKQEPQRADIDMADLLARNPGYGKAINEMIANQPDKDQIWYAFCLRVAEAGWTTDLRADYFRWFGRAQKWSGGHSFRKFLQNMDDEFWSRTSENERILIEAANARTPYKADKLPEPVGPGREWMLEEVRTLATDGLKERDFENGQKMFAATRCVVCHRFAGDGGATGPDLTQLAGRFNIKDLTEAIIEPSKVISDQYKSSSIARVDGQVVSGRIVAENESQISVLTDPEDSTEVVDIPKENIDEILPSSTSLMPKELLNRLNQDEVLDLLAYLLSRGIKEDSMFKR